MRVAALVLAAGAASRFGSPKALAAFEGRPLLEHVLDAVRTAGIEDVVVVLGHAAQEIEDGIDWLAEQRVRNPDPRLLSSSLQVGLAAVAELDPPAAAVVIALGDQPRTRPEVIRALDLGRPDDRSAGDHSALRGRRRREPGAPPRGGVRPRRRGGR